MPAFAEGYVRLDELTKRHPGWQDLLQLDSMMAHARSLTMPAARPVPPLPEARLPDPLPVPPGPRTDVVGIEQERIRSVGIPAQMRLERLQNTINVRNERAIKQFSDETRRTAELELREKEVALTEEAQLALRMAQDRAYVPLRDRWMREYAAESAVETYRKYPSRALEIAEEWLRRARQERMDAEAKLAAELESIQSGLAARLAEARRRSREQTAERIAQFRRELEERAERDLALRQSSVGYVLRGLTPLEAPVVDTKPLRSRERLQSPAEAARAQPTAAGAPLPIARSVADLISRRARMEAWIRHDVQRRLERLAVTHRWRLAFEPRPNLPDITNEAGRALRQEWTP